MLLYADALQHGHVGAVTAGLWIAEVLAPSAVGIAILGDTVRTGWTPVALLAVAATVAAVAILATGPANAATETPQKPPDNEPANSPTGLHLPGVQQYAAPTSTDPLRVDRVTDGGLLR